MPALCRAWLCVHSEGVEASGDVFGSRRVRLGGDYAALSKYPPHSSASSRR